MAQEPRSSIESLDSLPSFSWSLVSSRSPTPADNEEKEVKIDNSSPPQDDKNQDQVNKIQQQSSSKSLDNYFFQAFCINDSFLVKKPLQTCEPSSSTIHPTSPSTLFFNSKFDESEEDVGVEWCDNCGWGDDGCWGVARGVKNRGTCGIS